MSRQAIVIGLGQYGLALASTLAQKGVEVLAVDRREEKVREVAPLVAEALQLDATDEAALARTSPKERDLCVCAIGDDSREASILVTALLRQLGATRVISRAVDPLHERILRLVGAHSVVNPEREFGERYATKILYGSIVDEIAIGEDLVLTELRPPKAFVGRTLAQLDLPRKYQVNVVGLRREDGDVIAMPDPSQALSADDLLLVVARPGGIDKLLEKVS